MAVVYSDQFIENVKLELLDRLGLKKVYFVKQLHDDLIYDAVGFERGSEHKFRVRPTTGMIDEFVQNKWMKVHSFKIKSAKN